MNKFERLEQVLQEQARVSAELRAEFESLKADDVFAENERLRQLVAELEQLKQGLVEQNYNITTENRRLKNELYEQMFNEKIAIINKAEKNIDAYFSKAEDEEKNKLEKLCGSVKKDLDDMRRRLHQGHVDEGQAIYERLNAFSTAVSEELEAARLRNEQMQRELYANAHAGIEQLKAEPLTDAQIVKRSKNNNFESMLGLKLFNRLGIALIIFGVIATQRSIFIFVLGLALLVFGELLNRKKPDVFSLGLTAGGVAVLYTGTTLSFFVLGTLTMYPALALCVLTTVLAFVLARRYNSQTIAAFALFGGYLPIASITGDHTLVYFAMGYFILLNIFSLSIAYIKKWRATQFMGFAANVFATPYIVSQLMDNSLSFSVNGLVYGELGVWTTQATAAVAYVFLAFVIFTIIPIISSYRSGERLADIDNILVVANTGFGSFAVFTLLGMFALWDYAGIMAIVFCAFYLLAALLLRKILPGEKSCRLLLEITSVTFGVLIVPWQFGAEYVTYGWLVEGVAMLIFGILAEKKFFRNAGAIIFALCVGSLFLENSVAYFADTSALYVKYALVTLATLAVLAALIYKKRHGDAVGIFKYAVVINLWVFFFRTLNEKIMPLIVTDNWSVLADMRAALTITMTLLYAYIIPKIKLISDKGIRNISFVMYSLSILALIVSNGRIGYGDYKMTTSLGVAATIVMVLTNLLAVLAMRDIMRRLTLTRTTGVEWYPIAISGFFVFLLSQNLVVRLDLAVNSVILTVVFALTSLGWVIFGFIKRYQYIRLFGLGLSFISAIKLFIIDLGYLEREMKIVSYFALGVALLAISFIYQYFNKRLDRIASGEEPGKNLNTGE